jgi:hypothetical protein
MAANPVSYLAALGEGAAVYTIPRTAIFNLVGDTIHAGVVAWQNPEASAIIVDRVVIDVTTVASGAGQLDSGSTSTSATTASDNLLDGIDVHSAIGAFSLDSQAGANGKGCQHVPEGSWVTFSQGSGSLAGMLGNAYITYHVAPGTA